MALHIKELINDTVVNVAQLLKEQVGATRVVTVRLDNFALGEHLEARDTESTVRLTRLETGILAEGTIAGMAHLECVRCLEYFDAAFDGAFDAEFRPSVDVRSGMPLPEPVDDEIFMIDSNHELDLAELLRQMTLLSLPMQPICHEACEGIPQVAEDEDEVEQGDERLAVLERLLEADSTNDNR